MEGRRSLEFLRRRIHTASIVALVLSLVSSAAACQQSVTGLGPTPSCGTAEFTGYGGYDDQEDLIRCLRRGIPIGGSVAAGGS